jgi:hypothetical protein
MVAFSNSPTIAVPVQCLNRRQDPFHPFPCRILDPAESAFESPHLRKQTESDGAGWKGVDRLDKLGVTGSSPVPPIFVVEPTTVLLSGKRLARLVVVVLDSLRVDLPVMR